MGKRQADWAADWQRRNPGRDIREELARLQECGWTQDDIARLVGRDRSTVSRWIKETPEAAS